MAEKPIIFSGPMVRAILDGSKTMTRRLQGLDEFNEFPDNWLLFKNYDDRLIAKWLGALRAENEHTRIRDIQCPYGKPGDTLWAREAFAYVPGCTSEWARKNPDPSLIVHREGYRNDNHYFWKPSIHMPRWASRITLEVVSVKVERLQDMHHQTDQFLAEGIRLSPSELYPDINTADKLERQFVKLWDSLNGKKPGCSWADSPWVWAIEFKRVKP